MRTLTRREMYDKEGKCILPRGDLPAKWKPKSKYNPNVEDEKHRRKR